MYFSEIVPEGTGEITDPPLQEVRATSAAIARAGRALITALDRELALAGIKLDAPDALVLYALRDGPCTERQLAEQFDGPDTLTRVDELIDAGYATRLDRVVSLRPRGEVVVPVADRVFTEPVRQLDTALDESLATLRHAAEQIARSASHRRR